MDRRNFITLLLGLPIIGPMISRFKAEAVPPLKAVTPTIQWPTEPLPPNKFRVRWYQDGKLLTETVYENQRYVPIAPPSLALRDPSEYTAICWRIE